MFIWIAVMIVTVFLDQLTKHLTMIYMWYDFALEKGQSIPLIENVLHLTRVHNTGMAFGMMDEKNERWVFMVVSSVAIVGILGYMIYRIYIKKKPFHWAAALALSLIVGGGIGNMIDRTVLGYVVDMIDFRLINFAVFNVADSFVCIGAGLLMVYMIADMIREERENKRAALASGEAPAESAEPTIAEPTVEPPVEPSEETADEPLDEPTDEPVEPPVEPVDEPTDEPAPDTEEIPSEDEIL